MSNRRRTPKALTEPTRFGLRHCAWCQQPFSPERPWGRFCQAKCRAAMFAAYHPRRKDSDAGRRAVAAKLLDLTSE